MRCRSSISASQHLSGSLRSRPLSAAKRNHPRPGSAASEQTPSRLFLALRDGSENRLQVDGRPGHEPQLVVGESGPSGGMARQNAVHVAGDLVGALGNLMLVGHTVRFARMARTLLGHEVNRTEDPQLLTGQYLFLADRTIEGMLHAVFVRSVIAHGRLRSVDVSSCRQEPGVIDAFTAEDLGSPT